VRCWVGFGFGRCGDEGSTGQSQLACAPGRLRKRSEAECGASGIGCIGLVMGKGGRLLLRMERVLDGDEI